MDEPYGNSSQSIVPGSRVMAYYNRIYKNDVETPFKMLWRPATVIARYGKRVKYPCMEMPRFYPDLVDLQFDCDERISHGHFTTGVEMIHASVV